MFIQHYIRMILSSWRLTLIFVLLGWTTSLVVSYSTTPLYRATATFVIYPNASLSSSRDVVTSLDTLDKRSITSTYRDILLSQRVLFETVRQSGLEGVELNQYTSNVNAKPESNILELVIDGPNPDVAALLANNIGQNGIAYIQGLYQVFDISFLDQAYPPEHPFRPRTLRDAGIGAAAGLLAGMLVSILHEQLRSPLETLRERMKTDRISLAYTQRYFLRVFEQERARNQTEPLSIGFVSLDGLEDIIDGLSEPVKIVLMRKVTAILENLLRGNDIVGRWDKLTYAVMLPSTSGPAAARTMERIRQTLLEPVELEPAVDRVALEPRVGVTSRQADESADQMVQNAIKALEKSRQMEGGTMFYPEEN